MFSNRDNQNARRGPLGPIIKGVAAGIGLASEYRQHHKEQDADKKSRIDPETTIHADYNNQLPAHTPTAAEKAVHDVETDWHLDEAQDELINSAEASKPKTEHDPTKMIKAFTQNHPLAIDIELSGLSLPVVLPQRRPKDRTRGFIRAYAPELQNCAINQETFISLVETLNTATLASPWLDAINLASFAFMALPTGISIAISIAITIAVDTTKTMQSRRRHNYVLDQLNDDFFRPRGLYALILTWNPDDSNSTKIGIDLNETIVGNLAPKDGMLEKAKHDFRPSMGNTIGTAFAETSPLIFPALDNLAKNNTEEAKEFKRKVKEAKGFIGDYFDRRAQAEHAGQHPDSQLAVTKPAFTSRYSDPNNATNSGDLLALASGGKLSLPARRSPLARYADLVGERGNRGFGVGPERGDGGWNAGRGFGMDGGLGRGRGNGPLAGGIQRVFQKHILYLAIVNMPSEEELAEAATCLNRQTTSRDR